MSSSLSRRILQNPNRYLSSLCSSFASKSSSCSNSSSLSSKAIVKSNLIDLYREKDLDALVDKFKQSSMHYRFRSKKHLYDTAVQRLASANRFDAIHDILDHQKNFSDISREGFAIRLICLYGESSMFSHARQLFDDLPQLNCPRTVDSFNALLSAAVDSKQYETAVNLFDQLPPEIPVEPDTVSYNVLIQALLKMGSFDKVFSVLESMRNKGLRPSVVTFNSLLNGFVQGSSFDGIDKIWSELEKSECVPNIITYNTKLLGFVCQGKMEEAVKVVDEIRNAGLEPNIFSFNALIRGYCGNGNVEEAKKVYSELEKNKCSPNKWTFTALIPHLVEIGVLASAKELSERCMRKNFHIDVSILQGVVNALVKESKWEEAKQLVELGKSKSRYFSSLNVTSSEE